MTYCDLRALPSWDVSFGSALSISWVFCSSTTSNCLSSLPCSSVPVLFITWLFLCYSFLLFNFLQISCMFLSKIPLLFWFVSDPFQHFALYYLQFRITNLYQQEYHCCHSQYHSHSYCHCYYDYHSCCHCDCYFDYHSLMPL